MNASSQTITVLSVVVLLGGCQAGCLEGCSQEQVSEQPTLPIAECTSASGDVRTHPASEWVWNEVRVGTRFSAGDWVRTEDGAHALLTFLSGSALQLQPSSIVVIQDATIEKSSRSFSYFLLVKKGVVRGKLGSPAHEEIIVDTGANGRVRLLPVEGAGTLEYRLTARADGAVELAVTQGRVVLAAQNGERVELSKGQAQDLKGESFNGKVLTLPDPPMLEKPGIDASVAYSDKMTIMMRWRAPASAPSSPASARAETPALAGRSEVNLAHSYRLEIATDQSFQNLVESAIVEALTWPWKPRQVGSVYWRVASRTSDGRDGEFGFARKLTVREEPAVDLLLAPADGTEVVSPDLKPLIQFSWKAVSTNEVRRESKPSEAGGSDSLQAGAGTAEPNTKYRITIARDPELSDAVLAELTESPVFKTRMLKPGTYYWGVHLLFEGGSKPLFLSSRRLVVRRALGIETPEKITF